MIRTDYHIHTKFSIDADAAMEDMIKRAVELNLTEIALTDHVDHRQDGSPFPFQIDYDDYLKLFNRLKDKYSDRIRLVFGVEIGVAPHLVRQVAELAAGYPFEFIIASSHDIGGVDLYSGNFFDNRDKKSAYGAYFSEILENVRLFDCFNVYGHLDYINRYGIYGDNSVYYEEHADIIDAILTELVRRGKGLEVNSSGFRYGLNQVHPQLRILKRYKELGGEVLTVGSDAHRPVDIAADFDRAEAVMRQAGFTAYTVFRNNQPEWVDF